MRVVLLLSFYDEYPSWLSTVVAGFARVCDEIVAVDGAYGFYPGSDRAPRSHIEQAEAIQSAAEAAGVGCTIHRPRDPFAGNEVEKRNLTLALAAAVEPDWVVVADGDYHITHCDPATFRALLDETDLNAAAYLLGDSMDYAALGMADTAAQNGAPTSWAFPLRDIFRWTPDLAYGPAHFTVSGTYEGRRQWLKGPEGSPLVVPCLDTLGSLVAAHRNRHREKGRRDAADRYARVRVESQIEAVDGITWA